MICNESVCNQRDSYPYFGLHLRNKILYEIRIFQKYNIKSHEKIINKAYNRTKNTKNASMHRVAL